MIHADAPSSPLSSPPHLPPLYPLSLPPSFPPSLPSLPDSCMIHGAAPWQIAFALLHARRKLHYLSTDSWSDSSDDEDVEKFTQLSLFAAVKRMLLEQLFFAPVINAVYLLGYGMLNNQTIAAIRGEVRGKFFEIWKGNVRFWAPVSLLNFWFIGPQNRLLVSRLASLVWTVYLIKKGK